MRYILAIYLYLISAGLALGLDPVLVTEAQDSTVDCGTPNVALILTDWYESAGGAEATDPDGGTIIYSANLDLDEVLNLFEQSSQNLCGRTMSVTVAFIAIDEDGENISVGSATFAAIDETDPLVTQIPVSKTYECQEGLQDTLIEWIKNHGEAVAEDLCSELTWTTFIYNDSDGNSGIGSIDNGPYPVIMTSCETTINMSFVVEDECGNERATTGSFTIIDDTPPLIEDLPDEITVSCDNIPSADDVMVTDFCDPDVIVTIEEENTQTGTEMDCSFYNYTIDRIFSAVDECGNMSTDTIKITVADLGPPIVNGIDTINISCQAYGDGDTILIVAIDDCSMVNISYTESPYTVSCKSTVDRIYSISDICGNEVDFSQHIIIEDVTPPTYTTLPTDGTISCTDLDTETAFQQWLSANLALPIIDGCSTPSMFAAIPGSYDIDDLSTFPGQSVGTFDNTNCPSPISGYLRSEVVDFVIYDDCGNADVHQAVFGVEDNSAPMISNCVEDIEIILANGACDADVNISALVIDDDCVGEYTAELTLAAGFTFTLNPSTNNTINNIAQGSYSASFIVTDCAGNTASCQFSINILDQENPVIENCPEDIDFAVSGDLCTYMYYIPTADIRVTDNCQLGMVYSQKRPSQLANELLTFSETTGTPRVGNETFTFDDVFTIRYTEKPVRLSVSLIADIDGTEDYFTIFGEDGYEIGVTSPSVSCAQSEMEFSIPVSIYNDWLGDDRVDISIIANMDNTIMPCGVLQSDGTDGRSRVSLALSYDDAVIGYTVSGATTINSQLLTDTSKVELNVGQNIVTFSTADISGNDTTCSHTVIIADITPPEAICKNTVINIHPDGEQNTILDPSDIDGGSSDLCGDVILSVIPSEFTCEQVGTEVEVKLLVNDISGNTDSCTAIVKIEPYELSPTFSAGVCQDDTLKLFSNTPIPTTPGSYTYAWSGPNFTSSDADPFILGADASDNGTYTVVVTGFNGCQTTGSVQVIIPALTTPELTAESDTICLGEDLVLSATAFTGNISYDWYEGTSTDGVLLSTTMEPSLVITPTEGSHAYTVVAVSENCTSNPSSILSTFVTEAPIANVNDNFINVCEGESFSLGTSAFGAGYAYEWTGPDGYTSDKPLPEEITDVTIAQAGEYSLIISVGSCQSDTVVTRVNVFDRPVTPIITSGETFCEGSTVSLTVNNIPNADLYTWYLDGEVFITENDNSLVIQNAQASNSGSWQVSVQDGLCTSDTSDTQNIVIEDLQDISVTNSGPVCEGDSVQLFVTFIAGANYKWTGPEDFMSEFQNPKLLAVAGDYTVEIVTGTNCQSSASTTVVVNTAPVITALSNNSAACMDGETNIVFFPTIVPAMGNYIYSWSGPDGFMSDILNPIIVNPTEADNGTYTLVVLNDNCSSQPVESTVDITIIPEQPTIIVPDNVCNGNNIELTCSISAPGYAYRWNTPSTTVVTSDPVLQLLDVDNASEGEYTVTIEIAGCTSLESEPIDLEVTPQPLTPTFTTNSPVCFGEELILSIIDPVAGANYIWNGPNTISSNAAVVTISMATNTDAGMYSVSIDDQGCQSDFSAAQQAVVKPALLKPKSQQPVYDVCVGITSGLEVCLESNSAEPGALYTLTNINNNNTIVSGTSICYVIEDLSLFDSGSNFLVWSAELEGCVADISDQFRVDVSQVPSTSANILQEDMTICTEESINLNAQHGPPLVELVWSSLDNSISFSSLADQTTTVSNFSNEENLIILSYTQNACVDYSRDTITVFLAGSPLLEDDEYSIDNDEELNLDILDNDDLPLEYNLTITSQPQVGNLAVDGESVTYTPDDVLSGEVTFMYEICNTACPDNCDEATVTIQVSNDGSCIASTIITPNDDGINDHLEVTCLGGSAFPDNSLIVLNQWGDEVYSANNYENNWAGTYQGEPLPVGTYFYILDLADGRDPIHSFIIIQR